MKQIFIIIFLLTSVSHVSFASPQLDSLKKIIAAKQDSPQKLKLLLELIDKLSANGNKETVVYAESAYKLADRLKDYDSRSGAASIAGYAWQVWGNNAKAVEYYFKALIYYKDSKQKQNYANTLRQIGESYRAAANLDKSLEYLYLAEKEFAELNDYLGLAKTYNGLAATYYEVSFNNDAFRDNNGMIVTKFSVFNDFYNSSPDLKAGYDSTVKYVYLSNAYAKKANLPELEISTNIILGALFNNFLRRDSSFVIYNQAITKIRQLNMTIELPLALFNIAGWYYNNKQYDLALSNAEESYRIAKENDFKAYIYLSAGLISSTYEKLNKFKEANIFTRISMQERMKYFQYDIDAALVAFEYEQTLSKIENEINFSRRLNTVLIVSSLTIISVIIISLLLVIKKRKKEKLLNTTLLAKNEIISEQNRELEQLNLEKDKFFSIIAHDLRNPIGAQKQASIMFSQYYEDMSEEERKEMLYMLKESSERVFALLENLLEWSRAQSGKIEFNPVNIDISELVRININLLDMPAKNKSIEIIGSISEKTNIIADANMINTVLRNLLSNAIKFTPLQGTIEIGIVDNLSDELLTIFIKDSGIGMNSSTIDRLFKLEGNDLVLGTSGEKGTGLGLILCREFVDKHGGKIWAESEIGVGSTFFVSLPRELALGVGL